MRRRNKIFQIIIYCFLSKPAINPLSIQGDPDKTCHLNLIEFASIF